MAGAGDSAIRVAIEGGGEDGEEASGLAFMLHQFVEQTLESSPRKRRLARRLRGEALFRAAEDEAVCVSLCFTGDCIVLRDGAAARRENVSSITADFLSIAHLTSGQESPLALFARRGLRARLRARDIPFLLGMFGFMRTREGAAAGRREIWLGAAGAAALAAAIYACIRFQAHV